MKQKPPHFSQVNPQLPRNRPLRNNMGFMVLVIVIILLGFSITSTLSYLVTKNYVVHSAVSETLPLISNNIYSEIEAEIMNPINVSSLMSNDTFLINWVSNGEEDKEQIMEYLNTIKEKYGYDSAFFVSDISGNYYYYDGILKQVSQEDAHDDWYYTFRSGDKAYVLDVDTDEAANGMLTIFINHRLKDQNGEFLGATGVGLQLSNLGKRFEYYQKEFDHKIYLIDSNGLIQVHSDPSLVATLNIQDKEGISEISDEILSTGETADIFEYTDQSGTKALSVRYIPEFDWLLMVEKNEDVSLQMAKASMQKNILIGVAITVIVSGLLLWLLNTYNKRLEYLAAHDELTGLFNRRAFHNLMEREFEIARRHNQPTSLLMLDIDEFKNINDTHGHIVGDRLLQLIGYQIHTVLRGIDIVARWGGDEFIALLVNTDSEGAENAARRLQEEISQVEFDTGKGVISLSLSIGITSLNSDDLDAENFVFRADQALYQSKDEGKNQIKTI